MPHHCLFLAIAGIALTLPATDDPIQPVPLTDARFTGGLLHNRQATNDAVTIQFVLDKLESEGRLRNFDLAAEVTRRRAAGETNFQIRPPRNTPLTTRTSTRPSRAPRSV